MSDLPNHPIRFADLPTRKRTHFTIEPDSDGRKAIAKTIRVLQVKKLHFDGSLIPTGKRDWRIEATLGATVSQACVISLDPVTTRIDEQISRSYISDFDKRNDAADDKADDTEVEMIEDDTTDPLPEILDLIDVITEALVLTMPSYPRKDGIEAEAVGVTEPGKSVMTDEDARPFAGLAALRAAAANRGANAGDDTGDNTGTDSDKDDD
ncbi:hypothetical protein OAN307_c27340 [Octadecabacter antarcticus 307]|uniref:DUF177 domain-containing protein n=1 Tax=Octadecabacter antarcticus 307 TaxID=391626 RepID=M9RD20_9RHOB|nr:DUF177 domain-containing protein [Octadecabacter antarcticus]AGI68311.1 hypothetical protein OAN307_c27340 [Octadecabacter antarcticus 307]